MLLNSESDGCVVEESVLVPEMYPAVFARGTAVPTSLPTISEVFSSTLLAGGLLLRQLRWPWWGQSQRECLSCRTLEANFQQFLMVLPWFVWRSWMQLWMTPWRWWVCVLDSRDEPDYVLPVMLNEHSLMCDLVWSDVIPANQDLLSPDVCGDDRFSPGVRSAVSLDWQMAIDSHGMAELFSPAEDAGDVVAEASPLAVVGTFTARVSVLPNIGSKLPADSDEATVDMIPANQDVGPADVCGDDRFSPGVSSDNSINWQFHLTGRVFFVVLQLGHVGRRFRMRTVRGVFMISERIV